MAHNLPIQLTPFVGRAREIAQINELLGNPACRLLTLAGPGGIGKTRLALQVAAAVEPAFADGVVYVDLQALSDPLLIPATIAQALDLTLGGAGEPGAQLARLLASRRLLLVLDNFEQLLDAAPLFSTVLAACPDLRCLVTSREVLNLQEEWRFPVEGLEIGDDLSGSEPPGDAVQLFTTHARRMRHALDLTAERPHVVEICRLAGGMPLAIELAAAWTKSLTCAAIAGEMRRSLAFLTTTLRNVPARHRSVHAALDASWHRLPPAEQTVFRRLAVFHGGFQRAAAEAIAGADLAVLTALVERSLVRWDLSRGRYMLHELVRQYAAERLAALPDEEEAAYNVHCRYFTQFLHTRTESIDGSEQPKVLMEIDADLDNIRGAWAHALKLRDADTILAALYAYYAYCDHRGRSQESVEALQQALDVFESAPGASGTALAYALAWQGWNFIRRGKLDAAWAAFEHSAAIYDRLCLPPIPGFGSDPLSGLGMVAHIRGDYAQSAELCETAYRRSTHDELNLAVAHYVLANARLGLGELDAARDHAQAAYTLSQTRGNLWFVAYQLTLLGDIARADGDYTHAHRYYQEGYAIKEQLADPEGMAAARNQLGRTAWLSGDYVEAERCHLAALDLYRRLTDPGGLAECHHGLGSVAAMHGDLAAALAHYRQALGIALGMNFPRPVVSLLVDGATVLAAAGDTAAAVSLLDGILAHPASDYEAHRRATELRATLPETAAAPAATPPSLDGLAAALLDRLAAAAQANARPQTAAPYPPLVEPLTPRETEVLRLLAAGASNPEIAAQLIVSVGTVKFYTAQIFGKLAVHNRTQAVLRAQELGLI